MRRGHTLTVALMLFISSLGACSSGGRESTGSADEGGGCRLSSGQRCPTEPYPYSRDVPARAPTRLDGVYARHIGPRRAWLPGKCRRCPPYRMLEGRQVLIFDTGRFFVVHPADGYKSGGHFEVSGNRVRIFNDPNCTATTGLYRYRLTASTLAFEVVSDPCPYEGLRRRYLTALRWHESSYAAGAEG